MMGERKGRKSMGNLIAFSNSFLSYLLLFLICVAVVFAAVRAGIGLRKRKDRKDELLAQQEMTGENTESGRQGI